MGWRERGESRRDSINWAKGDPYPYVRSRREEAVPRYAARVSKRQGRLPQDRMHRFFFSSSSSSFSSFRIRIVVCMITSVQRNRGRWKGASSGKSLPADFGRVRARVIARSCAWRRVIFSQGVYIYIYISSDVGVPSISTSIFSNVIQSLVPGEIFL